MSNFINERASAVTSHVSQGEITIYYILQVLPGHFLLPIVLLILVLSPKLTRHPTLYNLLASYTLSSVVSCLLLYAGRATGPQPDHLLCVVQGGLINGVSPMWATGLLALVYNIWSSFRRALRREQGRESTWRRVLTLIAPYAAFIVFGVSSLFVAFAHADTVNRDRRGFYCSMDFPAFTSVMSAYTSVLCFVSTGFQIHLGFMLYRNYRVMGERGFDTKFVIRTLLFGVYTVIGMFVSLTTVLLPQNTYSDIFAASFGMAVFFVFGTQDDIYKSVKSGKFWKQSETSTRLSVGSLERIGSRDSVKKESMV